MLNKNLIQIYRAFFLLLLPLVANSTTETSPLTHTLNATKNPIPAPELRLKDMDDEWLDLKTLQGKVVIINFWATWCPPCRREMGSLEQLYQNTKEHGVELLAINIGEDADTVFSFMGDIEPSPSFPILFDSSATLMEKWHVRGLPTTYILNKAGNIVYQAIGGRDFNHPSIKEKILALSREKMNP